MSCMFPFDKDIPIKPNTFCFRGIKNHMHEKNFQQNETFSKTKN